MSATEIDNEDIVADDVVVEDKGQPSFLDMSDADMMNAPAPGAAVVAEVVVEDKTKEAKTEKVKEAAKDADPEDTTPVVAEPAADDAKKEEAKDEKVVEVDPKKVATEVDKTKVKTEDKEVVKDEKAKEAPAAVVVDFEAEYKRLLTPFKANGRDIAVESVDDAIALMQMGANYNKKMAALKPNLKLMKMLENNGFMDEEKIGFLIDLGKKDPAAINKLVQDAGIDPMDLGPDKAGAYKRTTYAVDDREMELDTVLDEMQSSPTYTRTLDVVSNKWDVASKQVVSQSPQLLKVINDHMASGIYDLISKEVDRERVFGRLSGMSDIEAYRTVGDAIQARGGFTHLAQSQGTPKTETKPVVVVPKPKVEDDKLKDKRRAASANQPAGTSASKEFNPLELSDEAFSKLGDPKFL